MRIEIPNSKFASVRLPLQESRTAARRHEQGIALVITLILLAVITFMAITFLVLSTRDRGAVTTTTDQNTARLAADAALERAKSDMIARMLATTNSASYDLFVSTNYANPMGFFTGNSAFTNVSFSYANGAPLLQGAPSYDMERNLQNLFYDPRPPVYITNRLAGSNDFRYYVDLNRNRRFEPSGLMVLTNSLNQAMSNPTNASQLLTDFVIGDPQWIGILEKPGFPHSPSNRFVARIAFIALPASRTLDLNYMGNVGHRVSGAPPSPPRFASYDYLRNQGVASYEDNLAAFFRDLNTNSWPAAAYNYNGTNLANVANLGNAFDDARELLWYRNQDFSDNNKSVRQLYGNRAATLLAFDHIDEYCNGPVMLGTSLTGDNDAALVNLHWFGADNTNHFFSTQDLFDPNKTALLDVRPLKFTDRLAMASTNSSSYDRYTLYRLFSQLGTDAAPEPTSKMNLNYDNLVGANAISGTQSATNFIPWTNATSFFQNAAKRMFNDTFGNNNPNLKSTRIPVSRTNNLYTASVHRLLQVAANLYDSITNQTVGNTPLGFPSVFRPIFRREASGQVIIVGYREVKGTDLAFAGSAPMVDADTGFSSVTGAGPDLIPPVGSVWSPNDNYDTDKEPLVSGIPLIVGAKKGWPNFNQFGMHTVLQITRKMQFLRHDPVDDLRNRLPWATNIMYIVSITNSVGAEAWNSYTNVINRDLQMICVADMTAMISNAPSCGEASFPSSTLLSNRVTRFLFPPTGITNIPAGSWQGFQDYATAGSSFQFPLDPSAGFYFLTNCTDNYSKQGFSLIPGTFEDTNFFPIPHWWLKINTRFRYILMDTAAKRIVDYVNLDSTMDPTDKQIDLAEAFTSQSCKNCPTPYQQDGSIGGMFCPNRIPTNDCSVITDGMRNQIAVSFFGADTGNGGIECADWNSFQQTPPGYDVQAAVNFFRTNLNQTLAIPGTHSGELYLTNQFFAPYAPTRTISFYVSWSANDPLVHYMLDDLKDVGATTNMEVEATSQSPMLNLRARELSKRYDPWGGRSTTAGIPDEQKFDLTRKDPAMFRSDNWDFPTNRWPNVGWIGRVHRGSPWQTVYLKQPASDPRLWKLHSGNARQLINKGQIPFSLVASNALYEDAAFTRPTNDWRLVDLFTTVINDNASRGQMSINQPGLAAWSAILSGVIVLTNISSDDYLLDLQINAGPNPLPPPLTSPVVVDPAGEYDPYNTSVPLPPLVTIVNAINATRSSTNLFPRQTFSHLGDILAVPEFTVASPFLNQSTDIQRRYGLSDEIYERIPQQVLGLLKVDDVPRFVIYSWGQALKPADRSVIMSGPYSGLCTNYQISAEVETRATVRIEDAPDHPHVVVESYNIIPAD